MTDRDNPPACRMRGGLCDCPVYACRIPIPVIHETTSDTIPVVRRKEKPDA